MTNEQLLDDLKQFIATTISQQTAHLDQRLGTVEKRMTGLENQVTGLQKHLDEQLDGVADTLTRGIAAVDVTEELQDHERRLLRLERRAA